MTDQERAKRENITIVRLTLPSGESLAVSCDHPITASEAGNILDEWAKDRLSIAAPAWESVFEDY